MEFAAMAELYEKLESTSKRLQMTDDLAAFFKTVPAGKIRRVIYLLQGILVPEHLGIQLGIGDKLCEQALVKVSGKTITQIESAYRKTGDLGQVAESTLSVKSQKSLGGGSLTVDKVYDNLYKLATTSGEGSQDQKINLLSELFSQASPTEAKAIARFVTGRLRLGVAESTILDALSVAHGGDKTHKDVLERAFNLTSDLGKVAETFFDQGLGAVAQITPEPFHPIRPALAERLPTAKEIIERLGACAVEAKYDGLRCITGHTPIYVEGKGLISARYVNTTDRVLTHQGRFRRVLAKSQRTIDKKERLFRFQTFLGNEFKITEGHSVYVLKEDKPAWIPVEQLTERDEVVFPLPDFTGMNERAPNEFIFSDQAGYEKKVKFNREFYRFLGYWVGDGFTNEFHNTERIGLIFNQKATELKEKYKRIVKKTLGIRHISENNQNGATYVYWRDSPFKNWLSTHFRREWKGKMIPKWFANLDKHEFVEFLEGWLEADGHVDSAGRKSITTKEADLAAFAQLIALKHGIVIGIRKIRVGKGNYFKLVLTEDKRKARIENGKLIVKILRLNEPDRIDPRTKVWNFQVEGDESYCTTMIALHNCQIHKDGNKVEIYSRRQEKITPMFPDVVAAVKEQFKAEKAIFEGEAIGFNAVTGQFVPFQETIQRKRKHEVAQYAEKIPVKLFAFELLYADGKDWTVEPYSQRQKELARRIKSGPVLAQAETQIVETPDVLEQLFDKLVGEGLEGIMAKDLNAPYNAGARKFAWIKLKRSYSSKLADSLDVVILGYYLGKGKRTEFGFGGLLTGVYDDKEDRFRSIAKIGTGFSEQHMDDFRKLLQKDAVKQKPNNVDCLVEPDVWVLPRHVITVIADEITRSPVHTCAWSDKEGLALRFPRIKGFVREDKKPTDATSESEVLELYEMQRQR